MRALCSSLLALTFTVPPPPPPDDAALPAVDESQDESLDEASSEDTTPDEDGAEPDTEGAEPGDDTVSTDAEGEPTETSEPLEDTPPSDPSEPTSVPATASTGSAESGDLDLDPYGRDSRPRETNPGRGLMISGLVVNGVAMAVGIGGLVYVGKGAKARNDLDDAKASGNTEKRVDAIDRIETSDQNAIILGAVAGGLFVVGTTLYFVGRKKKREAYSSTALVPSFGPQHAGVVLQGRF